VPDGIGCELRLARRVEARHRRVVGIEKKKDPVGPDLLDQAERSSA
jgi:hypothetical protein